MVVDGSWMPHNETHVTSGTTGCIHQSDCSFNGNCSNGTCRCAPAWHGKYCEKLATMAGSKALGYQGRDSGGRLSSWGGAVLRDNAGVYHLIGSEMIRHAGLLPWSCNSQVIHATSSNPLKQPFVKQRVLWHVFSHEPRCVQVPSGQREFVCYFSHNPKYPSPSCSGRDGETTDGCQCDNGGEKPTYMSFTTDIASGNWSTPVAVLGVGSHCDLNLSPYIYGNGSMHGLYRDNTGSNIHIATATDWRDPGSYRIHPGDLPGGVALPEDPFLYRDAQGIFHSLHHEYPWPNGPHAWSLDGWTWHKAPDDKGSRGNAYGPLVTFTDSAETLHAGCRERPSLVFGEDGVTPVALVNGFSPNPSHVGKAPSGSCRYSGVDYSYTLVQPLRTAALQARDAATTTATTPISTTMKIASP